MKTNGRLVAVIAVLLTAFAFRVVGLESIALWTDEGWTMWYAETQSAVATIERLFSNRHPPLYFVALSLWQNVAGNSHVALRIVAVFAGMITTAFVYRLGADWFNHQVALYASLLFAVLDIAIYYSQEIRHYGWLAMMMVIATTLFLRYLRRPTSRRAIPYLLSVTLLMLTHYLGLFIMLAQAAYGLFVWDANFTRKRNLVAIWVGAFVLYSPWMVIVISTLSSITRGVGDFPGSFDSTYPDLLRILELFFNGQVALLGGAYLVGLLSLNWKKTGRVFVVVAGGGLFVVMWFLNYRVGVLSPRMISFLTPFLMIICAYGLVQIPGRVRWVLVGVFVFTAANSTPVIQSRLNYGEMIPQMEQTYVRGDLIVLETGWTDFAAEYEIKQAFPESIPTLFATARIWNPDLIREEATQMLPRYKTVWVVQWLHAPVVLPRLLDGEFGFRLVEEYEIPNPQFPDGYDPIRVYRFQRPMLDDAPDVFGTDDTTLELHDAIFPSQFPHSDTMPVDLWWRTDDDLTRDYSVGVFLQNASGEVVTQVDAPVADVPTSQWTTDQTLHATRMLSIPEQVAPGEYTLGVVVYYFEDPANPLPVNGQPFKALGTITVTDDRTTNSESGE